MMIRFVTALLLVATVASAADFDTRVQPILKEHCFGCHNAEKLKGDIDLASLSAKGLSEADAEVWHAALDMINSGDMPPKKKPRLSKEELSSLTGWIETTLAVAAEELRANRPPARLRRLNRVEYRNTVADLIGHPFDAAELFTDDTVSHGFDNVGEALQVSPLHVEAYVAAAERVVSKIIDIPPRRPVRQHWRIINSAEPGKRLKQKTGAWHDGHLDKPQKQIKPGRLKGNVLPNAEIPNGSAPYRMLDLAQQPPKPYAGSWDIRAFGGSNANGRSNFGFKWFAYQEGMYRVAIKLRAFDVSPQRPAYVTVVRYPEGTEWKQIAVTSPNQTVEYTFYRDSIPWYVKTSGNRHWGLNLHHHLNEGSAGKQGEGVHVTAIDIEGPIVEQWPPASRKAVFFTRPEGLSDDVYARAVLERFMARAYRRPPSDDEVQRMMKLYERERAKPNTGVIRAMRLPLTTVLCTPEFLYIGRHGDRMPPAYAVASRLSYFLWRSMPDDELLALAGSGDLLRRDVVRAQIDRMLADRRSEALVKNFTEQWLGLRKIKNLDADLRLFPTYRLGLKEAMVGESTAFFRHVLDNDLPLTAFIDSSFAMLNDEMARHYNIPGVRGTAFRPVTVQPHQRRGGVLGQAAVLTATSNGVRTLPVNRGVFILEHILGSPPPSPPPDVGQLEDVKAVAANATTRQRLEQHRTDPNCARCHEKIDPLGFALENYDAIGRWRLHEVSWVEGKGHQRDAAVDASGHLPDGRAFKGPADLKRLLLADAAKFTACMSEKMLIYALDRPMGFADRSLIQQISTEVAEEGGTLRVLIERIALSDAFLETETK